MSPAGASTLPISLPALLARAGLSGGGVLEGELLRDDRARPARRPSIVAPPPATPRFSVLPTLRRRVGPEVAGAAYRANAFPPPTRRLDVLA